MSLAIVVWPVTVAGVGLRNYVGLLATAFLLENVQVGQEYRCVDAAGRYPVGIPSGCAEQQTAQLASGVVAEIYFSCSNEWGFNRDIWSPAENAKYVAVCVGLRMTERDIMSISAH